MTLITITKYLETTLPVLCIAGTYYNLLSNSDIVRNSSIIIFSRVIRMNYIKRDTVIVFQMEKILCRIKCDWDVLSNKTELIILKKYASVSRLCTIVIAGKYFLTLVIYLYVRNTN